MPLLTVNGAEIYHELTGKGPPVLLIMGATGVGGVFHAMADRLAHEYTVITYDRRGNGHSPRPAGWALTSTEEQADDAAALLDALDLAPAAVFGTSSGGIFALSLLIRHPRSVRGAILHEPAMVALFDNAAEVRSTVGSLVQEGMASGGPREALRRFLCFVAGDANWNHLDASLRDRMLQSAETYFGMEMGRFDGFLPDDAALGAINAPVQVIVSESSHPFFTQAATRLAERLGSEVVRTSGTHFPYLDQPTELVQRIRPFLQRVSH